MVFLPEWQVLAAGCYDGSLRLFDWRSKNLINWTQRQPYRSLAVQSSARESLLCQATLANEIIFWDIKTFKILNSIRPEQTISSMKTSKNLLSLGRLL